MKLYLKSFPILLSLLCSSSYYAQDNALDFDGINDNVNLGTDIMATPSAITVEMWVKSRQTGSTYAFSMEGAYTCTISPTGQIRWFFDGSSGNGNNPYYAAGLNDGAWHHIAATCNGTTTLTYVDGVNVSTQNESFANISGLANRATTIGSAYNNSGYFNGQIDEFRIWNDVRTPAEILNNMCDLASPAAEANLHVYYEFDETTGTNLPDVPTNNFDGTLVNMTNTDWIAGPCLDMTYVSTTVTTSSTSNVQVCDTNAQIIRVAIETTGSTNPIDLIQLIFGTDGSTNAVGDITNLDVYYTGASSTFATTTLYGSVLSPAASPANLTITNTQTLVSGTNYFWVVYDMNIAGTATNVVDAICKQITVGGTSYNNPGDFNGVPGGSRTIEACVPCDPAPSSVDGSGITNITLNTINNTTVGEAGNYFDYTAQVTNITQGVTETCSITFATGFTYVTKIWINWNDDGDFDDVGEEVYSGVSLATNPTTLVATFTVPVGATLGNHTMRIGGADTGPPTPCYTGSWGSYEDYTVNVVGAGPMTYSSTTVTTLSTANVQLCESNAQIIGIEIVTTGTVGSIDLTELILGTNGSTNAVGDITNLDVYYTGSSSTFTTTTLYGSVISPAASPANNTITNTQTLVSGTNYFWVVYDINTGGFPTNVVDAICKQLTIDGITSYNNPGDFNGAPANSRTIEACIGSPGGVASGLEAWVKTNDGAYNTGTTQATDGQTIATWADKSTSSNNFTQGTNSQKPIYRASGTGDVNFNPSLEFFGIGAGNETQLINSTLNLDNDATLYGVWFFQNQATTGSMHKTIFVSSDEHGGGGSSAGGYLLATGRSNSWDLTCSTPGIPATGTSHTDATHQDNNYHIGELHDASGVSSLYFDGMLQASASHATNQTFFSSGYEIGAHENANATNVSSRYYLGYIAEVIAFDDALGATDRLKVESYLAIKYGITLSANPCSMNYISSGSTSIWTQSSNTGYDMDIAGIGLDLNSNLDQPKSHSINKTGGIFRDIVTISNGTNFASPTSIATDQSFFTWGNNNEGLVGPYQSPSFTTLNPETIVSLFERHWKGQETGNIGTVTLEFDMSLVPGVGNVAGANDLNNLRMLVDVDGVFTTGATSISPSFVDNINNLVQFQHDFVAGTGLFFTVASINNTTTPLPVELVSFDATCQNNSVILNWTTASEINNDFFTIEKSTDMINFSSIGSIDGNGNNSSTINYTLIDDNFTSKTSYYRLKQTDFNGAFQYHGTVSISCDELNNISIYPNPFENSFTVQLPKNITYPINIEVRDYLNRKVYSRLIENETQFIKVELNQTLSTGAYFVKVFNETTQIIEKIMKRK